MKTIKNIKNFVYRITHINELMAENDALKAENVRLNSEADAARGSFRQLYSITEELQNKLFSANNEVNHAKDQVASAEKNYDRICDNASQLTDENIQLRSNAQMYHNAYKALCERGLTPEQGRAVYEAVASDVDKDGFELFRAAQFILGPFETATFAYEDNRGYFDGASNHLLLRYLLVQYDYKLGTANASKSRWQIACSCYEECVDLSIDKTTPEYQAFEKQLYIKVLENLNLLPPAETQAKEVAA